MGFNDGLMMVSMGFHGDLPMYKQPADDSQFANTGSHGPVEIVDVFPFKMVMFNSYVSLSEVSSGFPSTLGSLIQKRHHLRVEVWEWLAGGLS